MGESQRGLARQSTKSKAATKTTKSDCDRDKGFEKQRTAGKLRTMIMTRAKAVVTLALLFLFASAAGKLAFAAELVEVKTNDALAELARNMISSDGVLKNFTMEITANVTDLTPLSGLKHIKGGGLYVKQTTKLVSLEPLENLEVVDGDFTINGHYRDYNEALTDIPLPSLTEVSGDLGVSDNHVLASVSLPKLSSVGGSVRIQMLPTEDALNFFAGFSVASVGGDIAFELIVATDAEIAELAQQISSNGILDTQNATIVITANVTDLTPLSGLKHIKGGKLDVSYTTNLASLAPLENLEVVDGDLVISDNEALTDISLPVLTEVGGNLGIIYDNDALTDFSLPVLTEVGGWLSISFNAALTAISLPSLTEVGGDLVISYNKALTDISLPALTEIRTDLVISYNKALTDISLPALTEANWHLQIKENAALTDISLPSLTEVDGNIGIGFNAALTDLSLPSLTEVGGDLAIDYNNALTAISLPSLTEVGGNL